VAEYKNFMRKYLEEVRGTKEVVNSKQVCKLIITVNLISVVTNLTHKSHLKYIERKTWESKFHLFYRPNESS